MRIVGVAVDDSSGVTLGVGVPEAFVDGESSGEGTGVDPQADSPSEIAMATDAASTRVVVMRPIYPGSASRVRWKKMGGPKVARRG